MRLALLKVLSAPLVAAGFSLVSNIASAIPIDPGLYGHLNQRAVNVCGNENIDEDKSNACGPVAAANSLTYLANNFDLDGIPNTLQAANDLSGYMGCTCTDGTYLDEFIHGKRSYLDSLGYGPNLISIEYQTIWGGVDEPGLDHNAHIWPTLNFLSTQIKRGQDVELLVGFNRPGYYDADGEFQPTDDDEVCDADGNFIGAGAGAVLCPVQRVSGHFLTVNGVDNPLDQIYTIDPWGIDTTTVDGARIGSYGLSFVNPWLEIDDYLDGFETRIEGVVAESLRVPEPATLPVLAGGFILIGFLRWRRQQLVR